MKENSLNSRAYFHFNCYLDIEIGDEKNRVEENEIIILINIDPSIYLSQDM